MLYNYLNYAPVYIKACNLQYMDLHKIIKQKGLPY